MPAPSVPGASQIPAKSRAAAGQGSPWLTPDLLRGRGSCKALELLQDRASVRLWSSHAHSQSFDSRPLGPGCASRAGDSRSAPRGRGHHPSLPRGARTMCCPRVTARGQRAAPGGSGFALGSGSGITSPARPVPPAGSGRRVQMSLGVGPAAGHSCREGFPEDSRHSLSQEPRTSPGELPCLECLRGDALLEMWDSLLPGIFPCSCTSSFWRCPASASIFPLDL